jgi:hypothetical protein
LLLESVTADESFLTPRRFWRSKSSDCPQDPAIYALRHSLTDPLTCNDKTASAIAIVLIAGFSTCFLIKRHSHLQTTRLRLDPNDTNPATRGVDVTAVLSGSQQQPVSVYQLVRHVGKGLATRMVMLGTALTAVDMQHLGMVVDVVERDELREAALTLGRGCAIPFAAVCQGGDRTHRAIATRARSARERGRDAGLPHGGGAPRLCRTILAAHGLTHAQQCIKRASNCSTVAIGAPKAAA